MDNDFTAQFAAGVAYGFSGRTEDFRDYLVGCMVDKNALTNRLNGVFKRYKNGKIEAGNEKMVETEPFWRVAMADCPDSNPWFDQFDSDINTFLARDDWDDVAAANYAASQDVVDLWWSNCLLTWNQGVYFNAGMFYGEIMAILGNVPSFTPIE